ncbi:hypothetical protein R9X47_03715 [Wukongibacter baidiensis]|uniref:hypothetical protein n=1 Tax=Wukongibacter baidiensis TaxID=1723361 RepID=UPI003D7F5999
MKIEFLKDGFKINSKKIDPLNFKISGYEIKNNIENDRRDPMEILLKLVAIKDAKNTDEDKIKTLKSMVDNEKTE